MSGNILNQTAIGMQSIHLIAESGRMRWIKSSRRIWQIKLGSLFLVHQKHWFVGTRWVFKLKDENPPIAKARFVAKGFSQQHGVNYDETYAPVVKPGTLRVLFQVAAYLRCEIHQMDVVTAFLNSTSSAQVLAQQPEGYTDPDFPDHVLLLLKTLYGLKQSAFDWYNTFKGVLTGPNLMFTRIISDHAVFIIQHKDSVVYLALFVDDMLIIGNDKAFIAEIKSKLSAHFKMKDLGIAKRFLGMEIERNTNGDVILSQHHYIERMLQQFGMEDCKPIYIPLDKHIQLHKRDYNPDNCKVMCPHATRVIQRSPRHHGDLNE
jgi:hypothetical protein